MEINKRWQEEIKFINRGLYFEWDGTIQRVRIKHKDDRTAVIRDVMTIEDDKGSWANIDETMPRVLLFLKNNIRWDLVEKFSDPSELAAEVIKDMELQKKKKELERKGFLFDLNRENKHEWAKAKAEFERNMSPEHVKRLKIQDARRREKLKIIV